MRQVTWTDAAGYKHRALVRDNDPDTAAYQGIPLDPPDLHKLDWEGVIRDLHNELLERGIANWTDVQRLGDGVTSSILSVMRRRVIALYRAETTKEAQNEQPGKDGF